MRHFAAAILFFSNDSLRFSARGTDVVSLCLVDDFLPRITSFVVGVGVLCTTSVAVGFVLNSCCRPVIAARSEIDCIKSCIKSAAANVVPGGATCSHRRIVGEKSGGEELKASSESRGFSFH